MLDGINEPHFPGGNKTFTLRNQILVMQKGWKVSG